MSLKVIYVEDDQDEVNALLAAVASLNGTTQPWRQIAVIPVANPDSLSSALADDVDLVLADVCFGDNTGRPPERLDQIIDTVESFAKTSRLGIRLPIIACTSKGENTLRHCLDRREKLYDLWSKLTTFPPYVAWRFQQLAAELPRHRSDATLLKLVATMALGDCPPWHEHVLKLVRKYGEGQTEREQIRECRDPLQSILDKAVGDCAPSLMTLWGALVDSEPLLRTASPRLRGIGRHSINVFWFGYWLINHPALKGHWSTLWAEMLKHRGGSVSLKTSSIDPVTGLNTVWLLTSIFHDAGKFHEFGKATTDKFTEFYGKFAALGMGQATWKVGEPAALVERIKDVLHQLSPKADDPMVTGLKSHIRNCSKTEKPEHGTVAAAYLASTVCAATNQPVCRAYAEEAARAMLLHSCLPAVLDALPEDAPKDHLRLAWSSDPIACLLLFCDQVQTWDRHDPSEENLDYPDRAELAYLDVEPASGATKPCVKGCIDYIAPSRVNMYPKLLQDIKESLNTVILNKPKKALRQIVEQGTWPFTVHLDCALSGEKLDIDMDFA